MNVMNIIYQRMTMKDLRNNKPNHDSFINKTEVHGCTAQVCLMKHEKREIHVHVCYASPYSLEGFLKKMYLL